MVSVAVIGPDGGRTLVTKGAPENVFAACATIPTPPARLDDAFAQGSRVVAVATRRLASEPRRRPTTDRRRRTRLGLAGLILFRDPPKLDARASLERLATLGIGVKVVTGDNPVVALKVCRDLGLPDALAITAPRSRR